MLTVACADSCVRGPNRGLAWPVTLRGGLRMESGCRTDSGRLGLLRRQADTNRPAYAVCVDHVSKNVIWWGGCPRAAAFGPCTRSSTQPFSQQRRQAPSRPRPTDGAPGYGVARKPPPSAAKRATRPPRALRGFRGTTDLADMLTDVCASCTPYWWAGTSRVCLAAAGCFAPGARGLGCVRPSAHPGRRQEPGHLGRGLSPPAHPTDRPPPPLPAASPAPRQRRVCALGHAVRGGVVCPERAGKGARRVRRPPGVRPGAGGPQPGRGHGLPAGALDQERPGGEVGGREGLARAGCVRPLLPWGARRPRGGGSARQPWPGQAKPDSLDQPRPVSNAPRRNNSPAAR